MTWHIGGSVWHPASEDTLASRFAEVQAGRLRYCHEARAWFVFDGALWRRDRTGVASGRMRELARELCADPGGERSAASGKPGFVAGALRFAAEEAALAVTAADWDADPWLLGTPEAPVDLRTGAPVAADPRDGIGRGTRVAPAPPGAEAPVWHRFLEETFAGDAATIGFLQRMLGYALTGSRAEPVVVLGCGAGAGKSVLLAVVRHAMGDYAEEPAASTRPATRPVTRPLPGGTRLVVSDDSEIGGELARVPKLLAMAAAPPRLADAALRRRLRLVPFHHRPARPDHRLADALRAEAPAILRWMIDGALDWQVRGLDPPPAIAEATAEVADVRETLDLFLADCCERRADGAATAADLWRVWRDYAAAEGEPPGSQRLLAEALAARGFRRDRSETARFYRGIALRERLTHDAADA